MLMALFVGFLTGLGAIAFAELVDFVHWLAFDLLLDDWLSEIPHWKIILAPTLGGLLVGPLPSVSPPRLAAPVSRRCSTTWRRSRAVSRRRSH